MCGYAAEHTLLARPLRHLQVNVDNDGLWNLASRFIMLAYGFLLVIMTAVFTANTAAQITTQHLTASIMSISDLPGKKIGTTYDLVPYLRDSGKLRVQDMMVLPW